MEAVVIALIMIVTAIVIALLRAPGSSGAPRSPTPVTRPVPAFQDAVRDIRTRKNRARRGKGEGSSRDRRP